MVRPRWASTASAAQAARQATALGKPVIVAGSLPVPWDDIAALTGALRPPLAEAAGVVLPDARREPQECAGGERFPPVARAFRRRRVPQARMPAQLGEKLIE